MKLHPRLSRAAVALVTRFETFEPRAAPAAGGGWTVGYGHTRSAREGAEVTREDAEALLLYDLSAAAELVEQSSFAPLTAEQFEALTAFAFSVGEEGFRRSSALARLNAGAYLEAADEIERWRGAELGAGLQVVDALVRRRAAEKAHFLSLPRGAAQTASPRLRPLSLGAEPPAPSPPATPPSAAASSAALAAVDTLQARLRELIPDPPLASEPPGPEAPLALETPPAPELDLQPAPTSTPTGPILTSPEAEAPTARLRLIDEPPPPPYADDARAAPDPLSEDGLEEATTSQLRRPAPAADGPTSPLPTRRRFRWRGLFAGLIGLIGLLLFSGAALVILRGKPDLAALGAGVAGAVGVAIGLYALTGSRRR